jgi:RNA polymerase sigma-70 factor (ECF subfamily)
LAVYILGDPQAAEEVTQDVFLRIWENAGSYRMERAQVSTWLTSIARHRAIDILRRRGVRPEGHSVTWDDLNLADVPKLDGRNPEETADQILLRERVQQAIHTLPIEQQTALKMAFFYGYSHSQIAEQLGEPLGTIKTRIRMAIQKLHGILLSDE